MCTPEHKHKPLDYLFYFLRYVVIGAVIGLVVTTIAPNEPEETPMTIKIESRSGMVKPFKRRKRASPVSCRFCEGKVKKGEDAIQLTTACGATGIAFVCIPCADKLLENLAEELDKEPQGGDT